MNLFLHDIACAIERDATQAAPSFGASGVTRDTWLEEWRHRLSLELDPDAEAREDDAG